jgi:hypothetical protein
VPEAIGGGPVRILAMWKWPTPGQTVAVVALAGRPMVAHRLRWLRTRKFNDFAMVAHGCALKWLHGCSQCAILGVLLDQPDAVVS